ncbi:hypothetical protein [Glycomyces buryatensis]|uniref:Uncharacterized protein n=1 Tax=Glycomyces buryatensis TaxID=2570927 RepID=A0A4S8Q871_9ACTN|nr:hypothetical protein [Glycomyces buryatensis]THV37069.1 hypothetical protein FAB82_21200 [Glycomyces buryatensis]
MNAKTAWTKPEITAAAGLGLAASGIGILWAVGVEFPIYPPPGMLITSTMLAFFVLTRGRSTWAALFPLLLGLSNVIGFSIEGIVGGVGIGNLTGESGRGPMLGQAVNIAGVLIALTAGSIALTAARRRRAVPVHS